MDKKTYTKLMGEITNGKTVSKKTFTELVEFAKSRKIKQPPKTALALEKPKTEKTKKTPKVCSVTSKEDPEVGKKGCQKPARARGLCVAHYARLVYRQDPEKAEKAREASRRYHEKKRAEKQAASK